MTSNFYTSVSRHGNDILWRGYEDGERVIRRERIAPTLYLQTENETGLKDLHGNHMKPIQLDSMSEAKQWIEKYKGVVGFNTAGNSDYVSQFIYEKFGSKIDFDPKMICVANIDIEYDAREGWADMEKANRPITALTLKRSTEEVYHVFTTLTYDASKTELDTIPTENIKARTYLSEHQMLMAFVSEWIGNYPDVITGWNCRLFDIGYLWKRIMDIAGENEMKRLSPFGICRRQIITVFNRPNYTYDIEGIAVLDYLDVFKKFDQTYGKQESYKLDDIAEVVLGIKKLSYAEYGNLNGLMVQNPQKYVDYNIRDVELIQLFENKLAMLQLVYTMAYSAGVNFQTVLGTVAMWDTILYREMMDRNIICPLANENRGGSDFAGGYVMETQPGFWEWVVTFDLASLYPHIMMMLNISPETYMRGMRETVSPKAMLSGNFVNESSDYAVAANGVCFKKHKKGLVPEIIEAKYAHRKKVKNEMLEVEQQIEDLQARINAKKAALA